MRAVLVVLAVSACAQRPAPEHPSQRALFRDLERQVTVSAATGWGPDAIEVEALVKPALDSACRVDLLDRRALATWIDERIRSEGGPVEQAWRERGKDLSAVGDLLVLTRVQKLLARAEALALECPFWIEPEHPFLGRQTSDRAWLVSFGGGGKGTVVAQGGDVDLQFGGAGRLLFGRAFSASNALFIGIETGASAAFPKDEMGERTKLEIGVDVVAPLVYRRTLTNAYVEVEAGWLGRATERDWSHFDNGVHVGFAIGGRALRTRWLFPGAALGVSWERTFLDGDDVTTLKLGARVAFDLEL